MTYFVSLIVQSQLKLTEQLYEQARMELNKQIQERTQEKAEITAKLVRKFLISLFGKYFDLIGID